MPRQTRESVPKGCNAVEDVKDNLSVSRNLEGSHLSSVTKHLVAGVTGDEQSSGSSKNQRLDESYMPA